MPQAMSLLNALHSANNRLCGVECGLEGVCWLDVRIRPATMAPSTTTWNLSFHELSPDIKKALDPPGYDSSIAGSGPASLPSSQKRKDSGLLQRKQQAMFARATAPVKNMLFMCFMAWMSGNGIQIFSIMMTFNLLQAPISAIMTSGQMFPREDDWPQLDVLTPRLLFCVIQMGQLVFGLYKLDGMGLLPVFPSDWISTMAVPPALEHSFAAA